MMSNVVKPLFRAANPVRIDPINIKLAYEFIESRLGTAATPEVVRKLALCIEEIEK